MTAELDHVFILCEEGAPEAQALVRLGLAEGSGNTHPGQGTACRRFFFRNAYLELLWVHDPEEAQGEPAWRLRLWERWSKRGSGACPFGIVARPSRASASGPLPFATWAYRPSYFPPGVSVDVATETTLTEPQLFHMGFHRGRARVGQEPDVHPLSVRAITAVTIGLPAWAARSPTARTAEAMGLVTFEASEDYLLTLTFDHVTSAQAADLRPSLPLVLRWPLNR